MGTLPDMIELRPLREPVRARVSVPGSKSVTNRALVLAALARGRVTLEGALWSEDTRVLVDALRVLGFRVDVLADASELCNRRIVVEGQGGVIPNGGGGGAAVDLFVGNAGTAARFLAALVALGGGRYRLHGVARMHERPQRALFDALRQLGYQIDAPGDKLPAVVHGGGRRPGRCDVRIDESSQFASALLLCAPVAGWEVAVAGANSAEAPYVEMTSQMAAMFPGGGGTFQVEPDASSGSYFWAAGWLCSLLWPPGRERGDGAVASASGPRLPVEVVGWPRSGWQIDAEFTRFLPLPEQISRLKHLGDSIMTAIVLAPFGTRRTRFTGLGRLRVQECERVAALRTELTRCGAQVSERDDSLTVFPSRLHGAEIETYSDHRMAMCFAILGLKVAGVKIKNPACVRKTFPDFFQKLALAPPAGLGVEIVEAATGRALGVDELVAG